MTKINDILRSAVLLNITANQISTNEIIKNQGKQIFNQINNKNLYELNHKKKNKLLKIYKNDYKKTMSQKHKWVFTFYVTSIIFFWVIILSSILCFIFIKDSFDKYTISILVLTFGLSFDIMPYCAYKFSLNSQAFKDFYYLKNEKILVNENGFNYYYYDSRYNYIKEVSMFKFQIKYKDIEYVEYDNRVQEFFIYGKINVYEYKDNNWKLIKYKNDDKTLTGVVIQDIYGIDLLDVFKNNNVKVSNYNYLDRRKKEEQVKEKV